MDPETKTALIVIGIVAGIVTGIVLLVWFFWALIYEVAFFITEEEGISGVIATLVLILICCCCGSTGKEIIVRWE